MPRTYREGFADGFETGYSKGYKDGRGDERDAPKSISRSKERGQPKRKLSAWNKFVKANSKKKIYQYANGKLKLKKMGIAFRKTPAGRKK